MIVCDFQPMPSTETRSSIGPFLRNLAIVGVIMLTSIVIGSLRAMDAHDDSYILTALWIGIGLSIVFLLVQIASTVERQGLEA